MHADRFGDRLAHRQTWVEAAVGILEDHLGMAAEAAQLAALQRAHVGAEDRDLAGVGLDQAQHAASQGGLAAAAFADQAEGLARGKVEIDTIDGAHRPDLPAEQPTADREVLHQAADAQEGVHGRTHYACGVPGQAP